jgi:hypothetical protein
LSSLSLSAMSAGFYNQAELKPHKSRYWLHAEPDEAAEAKMAALTTLYAQAPALVEAGARGLATDEMTGLQALERKHPTRPMDPGCVERREFEYIQRGTLTLIAHVDVAQDTGIAPSLGPTRTEEDCMPHIAHTLTSDPEAHRWHFVVDNLNIHQFASPHPGLYPVLQCHDGQTL